MRALLREDLPLRTSAMLGSVAELFVLAHRYGDLTSGRFKLGRLNDMTFFVADHPMSVRDVFIDKQRTNSWEQRLEHDSAGRTWTVVVFTAPIPNESTVSATGTGKRNPRTGALIQNPADIVEDLLRIAGQTSIPLDRLRAECSAEGLRLAGSIDRRQSTRAWIDEVLESALAIWTLRMARVYPTQTVKGFVRLSDKQFASDPKPSANLRNAADILRVYYDPDAADDAAQHYIELTASPMRYGGIVREVTLPWLRTPADAESVGRRYLAWLAGKRWTVPFESQDPKTRAGDWVKLSANPAWPFNGDDPIVMVLTAIPDRKNDTVACTAETLVTPPTITVTGHSVALPTTREPGVEITVQGNFAILVVTDENDKPVLDAKVALDNGEAKSTDASGAVSFPVRRAVPPVQHRLAIQAPGSEASVQTVWL